MDVTGTQTHANVFRAERTAPANTFVSANDASQSVTQTPGIHSEPEVSTAKVSESGETNQTQLRVQVANSTEKVQAEQKRAEVSKLAKRDREVRAHELAHAAAGGQFAGAPVFDYTRGPDGVNYATSGHVSIDISEVAGDPGATLQKAQIVQRAATAPADPSSADRTIAAKAAQLAAKARVDILQEKMQGLDPEQVQKGQVDAAKENEIQSDSAAGNANMSSKRHSAVYQQIEAGEKQQLGKFVRSVA